MADRQSRDAPEESQFETIEVERPHDGGSPMMKSAFRDEKSPDNKVTRACLESLGVSDGSTLAQIVLTWCSSNAAYTWDSVFTVIDHSDYDIALGSKSLEDIQKSLAHHPLVIYGRRLTSGASFS